MIYYLLPTVALCLALCEEDSHSIIKQLFHILLIYFLLFIIILAGLRFEVGTDWFSYAEIFYGKKEVKEISTTLIKDISNSIGGFQSFIFLFFLIAFLIKIYAFRLLSSKISLALLVYLGFWFIVYDLNGIRQGVALSFTLLSLYYTIKRNLKSYLICCFIALTFHITAIAFLPFYWISKIKISAKIQIVILIIMVCFSLGGIAEKSIKLIFSAFGNGYLVDKAISYATSEAYNSNILFSFTSIHRVAIFFLILFTTRYTDANEKLKNLIITSSLINICIYFSFCQFEIIATRLSLFYRIPECIFFSYLPSAFKENSKYYILILIFIYVEWQIYQTLSIPNGGLIPYRNYFIEKIL